MNYEYSYGIVPLRWMDGRLQVLLILHKGGKHWGFPKGRPEPGEVPFESAVRELKEETGLSIQEKIHTDPFIEIYIFYRFQKKIEKKVEYFPAFVSGELTIQEVEILEARWFFLPDAVMRLSFKETKDICIKIESLLQK